MSRFMKKAALFVGVLVIGILVSGKNNAFAADYTELSAQGQQVDVKVVNQPETKAGLPVTLLMEIKNVSEETLTDLKVHTWYYHDSIDSEAYPGERWGTLSGPGLTTHGDEYFLSPLTVGQSVQLTWSGTVPSDFNYRSELLLVVTTGSGETAKWYGQGLVQSTTIGWKLDSMGWRYRDQNGYISSDWRWIDGKCYYFGTNSYMASDQWIGEYYVDSSGAWVPKYQAATPGWKLNDTGWWYQNADGSYPTDCWSFIDNNWYHFDTNGYMQTGWVFSGSWYYLRDNGAMATGWVKWEGKWYYLRENGAMATGWVKLGETWYYLNKSGAMETGWVKLGSSWYYLKDNGEMATGWLDLGGTKYYLTDSGEMKTGWLELGEKKYYLTDSGAMATGWVKLGETWYFFYNDGEMATGWVKLGETWYFFYKEDGAMAHDAWIGTYYVNGSGAWVPAA